MSAIASTSYNEPALMKNFVSKGRAELKRRGKYPRDCYDTEDEKELVLGNRQGRMKDKKIQGNSELIALEAEHNPHTDRGNFGGDAISYLKGEYQDDAFFMTDENWRNIKKQIHFYSVPVLPDRVLFRGSTIPNKIFNDIKRAFNAKHEHLLKSFAKELLHGERGQKDEPGYNPGICSATTDREVAYRFIRWTKDIGKTNILFIIEPNRQKPARGICFSKSMVDEPEHEVILDGLSNQYQITSIHRAKMPKLPEKAFLKDPKLKGRARQAAKQYALAKGLNVAANVLFLGLAGQMFSAQDFDYIQIITMTAEDLSARPHETAEETHAYAETCIRSEIADPKMYEALQKRKEKQVQLEKQWQAEELAQKLKEEEEKKRKQAEAAEKKRLAEEAAKRWRIQEAIRKKAEEAARREREKMEEKRRAEEAAKRQAEAEELEKFRTQTAQWLNMVRPKMSFAETQQMDRFMEQVWQTPGLSPREQLQYIQGYAINVHRQQQRQQEIAQAQYNAAIQEQQMQREAEEAQRNAAIQAQQTQQAFAAAQYNAAVQQQRQQAMAAQYNAAVQQRQNIAAQRQFQQRQMYMNQMFNAANQGNAQMQFGFNSFLPPRGPFGGPPFGGPPFGGAPF